DIFSKGNPNLEVESEIAYEMRIESTLLEPVLLIASAFRRDVEDMIAWAPLGEGGIWQPENIDRFAVNGGELEVAVSPIDRITIGTKATYLSAKQTRKELVYDDGVTKQFQDNTRDAAFLPKVTVTGDVTYRIPSGFLARMEGRYVSKRVNYYNNYSNYPEIQTVTKELSRVFLLGSRVSQEVIEGLEVFIHGENLLDREYSEQFGFTIHDRDFPRPGRTFTFGLKASL
ncbi:TonB-dependent receptor, partial [candidate division TA06 bacterium]|nr:TonB-dependent receptor [candidate division TA06 bacterium]